MLSVPTVERFRESPCRRQSYYTYRQDRHLQAPALDQGGSESLQVRYRRIRNHEPEQEAHAIGAICIGGQYYLLGTTIPQASTSVGWFTSSSDERFTWCDHIGNGHPTQTSVSPKANSTWQPNKQPISSVLDPGRNCGSACRCRHQQRWQNR